MRDIIVIEAGKITGIRFSKSAAEKINSFAAMHHLSGKTEAVLAFIEGQQVAKDQALLDEDEKIDCHVWNKPIALDACWNYQERSQWREKYCLDCKGKRVVH